MKIQDLFSSKDNSKKLKCCLLQLLFGALRVNTPFYLKLCSDDKYRLPSNKCPYSKELPPIEKGWLVV